jgi:hypothetical protein
MVYPYSFYDSYFQYPHERWQEQQRRHAGDGAWRRMKYADEENRRRQDLERYLLLQQREQKEKEARQREYIRQVELQRQNEKEAERRRLHQEHARRLRLQKQMSETDGIERHQTQHDRQLPARREEEHYKRVGKEARMRREKAAATHMRDAAAEPEETTFKGADDELFTVTNDRISRVKTHHQPSDPTKAASEEHDRTIDTVNQSFSTSARANAPERQMKPKSQSNEGGKHKKKRVTVLVEDASASENEDEFKSPSRNRLPSRGQWMEPVDDPKAILLY